MGDSAQQTTIGHHFVAVTEFGNQLLVLLGAFHLRTNQKEIENDKNDDQWQE
jgi:hypothetical protein